MNQQQGWFVLALVAFFTWSAARAEVSVDLRDGSHVNTIVLAGIVEGSDPIGSWRQFRAIPQGYVLNASGDARGDGPPDLSSFPDGRPVAVWAYNAGPDHDISLAEWSGTEWSPIEYLTVGPEDELDPRVFVQSDGTLHVVWWVNDTVDRVLVASKPPGAPGWSVPVQITASSESGRRPSVVVADGVLMVSYERDSLQPGAVQEVVVARREAGGAFTVESVLPTQRNDRLDTLLHFVSGQVWIDWKHDAAGFGRSECDAGLWGAPLPTAWTGLGWVGVEETRKAVRRQVFGN